MIKRFNNFIIENSNEQYKLFDDYINNKLLLTPIINILLNDIKNKWYSKIGEYIIDVFGLDYVIKHHPYIQDKQIDENKQRFIAIFFLAEDINEKTLRKIFGKPIKHSEFGEGFEPKRKYECSSYMVNINDNILHISYDHRGTSIECEKKLKPIEVFNTIKKLIDLFKEKIID